MFGLQRFKGCKREPVPVVFPRNNPNPAPGSKYKKKDTPILGEMRDMRQSLRILACRVGSFVFFTYSSKRTLFGGALEPVQLKKTISSLGVPNLAVSYC